MTASIDSPAELRPIALLRWTPEELRARRGIRFEPGTDDLDSYAVARFDLGGRRFALLRYDRSPASGTEVFAEASGEPARQLELVMDALDLRPELVAWTLSFDPAPATRPAVLVEPANPVEVNETVLESLLERLREILPELEVRPVLRPEQAFGVMFHDAVRLWWPLDQPPQDDPMGKELVDEVLRWMERRWRDDLQAHPNVPIRPRDVLVYDMTGQVIAQYGVDEGGAREVPPDRRDRSRQPPKWW